MLKVLHWTLNLALIGGGLLLLVTAKAAGSSWPGVMGTGAGLMAIGGWMSWYTWRKG